MKMKEIRARGQKVSADEYMMMKYFETMLDPNSPLNNMLKRHSMEEIIEMMEVDAYAREEKRW